MVARSNQVIEIAFDGRNQPTPLGQHQYAQRTDYSEPQVERNTTGGAIID